MPITDNLQNSANEAWDSYIEKIIAKEPKPDWLEEDILKRLQIWRKRFDVYATFTSDPFKKFNDWKNKNQLIREGEKLKKALLALEELETNKSRHAEDSNYIHMHETTLAIVKIQVTKLELRQLHMLGKAQNLKRKLDGVSLEDKKKELDELREYYRKIIEKRPDRFSSQAKNKYELNNTSTFFRTQERKIHFNKHFRRADKASDSFNVFNAFNNFLARIAMLSISLLHVLTAIGIFLQTVPFINAALAGATIVIHAAKMWTQNKSLAKQISAAILIGVVISGFITMGFGTLAAAGIAVALMGIGTYVKHIHPWKKAITEIRKKKKELIELDSTRKSLSENDIKFQLTNRERQFLMVKAEEDFLHDNKNKIFPIRQLIMSSNFEALNTNPKIKALFAEPDLKTFLLKEMDNREIDLNTEIKTLSVFEKRKRKNIISGSIAITGAILLCIPTPVTMILGATLLLVSAVTAFSLTFNLESKVKTFFANLFHKESTEVEVNDEKKYKKLSNSMSKLSKELHMDLHDLVQPEKLDLKELEIDLHEFEKLEEPIAKEKASSTPNENEEEGHPVLPHKSNQ